MEQISNASAHGAVTNGAINLNPAFQSASTAKQPSGIATTAAGGAQRPLTDRQIELLEARGIEIELAVSLGWRNAGRKGAGDWIEIPYFRDGVEVNYKQRTLSGEKLFCQKEGGAQIFYNSDVLATLGESPLIITEGEPDWIIAQQCGYVNSVSVPNGAPAQEIGDRESTKYDYLWQDGGKVPVIPKDVKKVILAVDGDKAGINLMNDLALRIGRHRCWYLKYPQGCKDLNDVFIAYGAKGVHETMKRAEPVRVAGLFKLSELPPVIKPQPFHVGIKGLEGYFKLRRNDLSVVTGIPNHGKTSFVNNVAFNMARLHGWNICFASFEQPPQTQQADALRTLYAGRPDHLMLPEEVEAANKWIDDHFTFIVPDDDSDEPADLDWLQDRMAAAVIQHNASIIVIDPWNEMDHSNRKGANSLTEYVANAIMQLKRFAKKYRVHVMIVAHPAKLKPKDGVEPIPTPYDISDSQHWYNKPEQIVIVHRDPESPNKTLIRIAKSRFVRDTGNRGDVFLKFNDYDYKYYPVDDPAVDEKAGHQKRW